MKKLSATQVPARPRADVAEPAPAVFATGVRAAVIGRFASIVLQGVANVILGRLLQPSDYGLVSFSIIVAGFVARFNDMGVESAVIQRAQLDEITLRTAFTIKIAMSIALTTLLWIAAPWLAAGLGSIEAAPVIRVLSINFILTAASFPPLIRLRKALRYETISQVWVISALAGAICSITLAFLGAAYWSIALGQVATNVATFILAQRLLPTRVDFGLCPRECRRLLAFGGRVFLSGILVFGCFNIDNFLIGLRLGAVALGLYSIAFNWATQICTFVSSTVLTVLFPAFANLAGDREKIRDLYIDSLRQLSLVGAIGYGILALVGGEFLVLVLGRGTHKWIEALPALQILCVYGMIRQLLEPLSNALLALGRVHLIWRSAAVVFVVELGGISWVIANGGGETKVMYVAYVVLGAYVLQYLVFLPFIKELLMGTSRQMTDAMLRGILPVLLLAILGSVIGWRQSWPLFGVKIVAGLASVLIFFWFSGGRSDLRKFFRHLLQRTANI